MLHSPDTMFLCFRKYNQMWHFPNQSIVCAFLLARRNAQWNLFNRYVRFNSNRSRKKINIRSIAVAPQRNVCGATQNNLCNHSDRNPESFKTALTDAFFQCFCKEFQLNFLPVVPIHRNAVQPVIVRMIHGIRVRLSLNGLCVCVLGSFSWGECRVFSFLFGFSSIKMAHNDTKAGRKRHIQLRQRLPSLASKNKHRQTHTYGRTSTLATLTDIVFRLKHLPSTPAPKKGDEKKKYVVMYSTYCIRLADSFVQVCNVCAAAIASPLNSNKSNFR